MAIVGRLELPMSLEAWRTVTAEEADRLIAELQREIGAGHVLAGRRATVVRRCSGCDDVIYRVEDEAFAVVHLTWIGREERQPWPRTVILRRSPGRWRN
jgi:hypothetical protein